MPELIDHIEMNTVDLSRIIGIIIDNAIEASEELEDALIKLHSSMSKRQSCLLL